MKKPATSSLFFIAIVCLLLTGPGGVWAKDKIVHDAEYYILEAQHGEKWAAEDKELNKKLAELKEKHGTPPNIIHIMWDDTPVGEIGIPQIQKMRGWETPKMNQFANFLCYGS